MATIDLLEKASRLGVSFTFGRDDNEDGDLQYFVYARQGKSVLDFPKFRAAAKAYALGGSARN